jgi:hypothetical protein
VPILVDTDTGFDSNRLIDNDKYNPVIGLLTLLVPTATFNIFCELTFCSINTQQHLLRLYKAIFFTFLSFFSFREGVDVSFLEE